MALARGGAAAAMEERLSERTVLDAVAALYDREAVLVRHVANATGAGARRTIDAIAIGLWPSRGLYLHAIEAKVSKSDYRRELKDIAKADELARYCDAFYVAATFPPPDDVPQAWGWYTITDGVAIRSKAAARIEAIPPSRSFIAALARRLADQHAPDAVIAAAEERGKAAGRAEMVAETRRAENAEMVAIRKLGCIEARYRGIDDDAIRQMTAIARNLRGEHGDLNALRVTANGVVRAANALEGLARRLLTSEESITARLGAVPEAGPEEYK